MSFGVLSSFGQTSDPGFFTAPIEDGLKVHGKIYGSNKSTGSPESLSDVFITLFKVGTDPEGKVKQDPVYQGMWVQGKGPNEKNGKYWFILDLDSKYIVTFRKRGYATVKVEFDTQVPNTDVGHVVYPIEFDVTIPFAIYNQDYTKLRDPIAKIIYQHSAQLFGMDGSCFDCKEVQKEIRKINAKALDNYTIIAEGLEPQSTAIVPNENAAGYVAPVTAQAVIPKPTPPPVKADPAKLDATVNSGRPETMHYVSADGNEIYFSRSFHNENVGGAMSGQDIWSAKKKADGTWDKAHNKKDLKNINNKENNTVVGFSTDGKRMYTTNAYQGSSGISKGIAVSKRSGDTWGTPTAIEIPKIRMQGDFIGFAISPDEQAIIITVNRAGSLGEEDLYVSTKNVDGTWSEPQHMGDKINSRGFETSPWIAPDGKTIYFASNGHGGQGNTDIFMARRGNSWTEWSEPVNLGPKINSSGDDAYFFMGNDGMMYFSSNRDGAMYDIYAAPSKEMVDPNKEKFEALIAEADQLRKQGDQEKQASQQLAPEEAIKAMEQAKTTYDQAAMKYEEASALYPDNPFPKEMVEMIAANVESIETEIKDMKQALIDGNTPPVFNTVNTMPDAPLPADEISIKAKVTDNEEVKKVTLVWGTSPADMGTEIIMQKNGDEYSTTLPAQNEFTTIYYEIVATDNTDKTKSYQGQIVIEETAPPVEIEPIDIDPVDAAANALLEAQEQERNALAEQLEEKSKAEQQEQDLQLENIYTKASTRKIIFELTVAEAKKEIKMSQMGVKKQ